MKTALLVAGLIVVAGLAMLIAGANPAYGYYALVHGSLGGGEQLAETLVQTTSLLFPSLAVAFAFRAGLFNIGAEGQLIAGGLVAGVLGTLVMPQALALGVVVLGGAVGGGVWGAIAGVLRARFGANEVIATLMLNIIAALLANYLVVGPLHAPGIEGPETAPLPPTSWLPVLFAGTRLSAAFPLALLVALGTTYFFAQTILGYEMRAVGEAPLAAARAGIDVARIRFLALTFSGAIAGIGGATIVCGVLHRFNVQLSPGYGFIAIAVALVGRLDPVRICFAAFAFGMLQSGSLAMQAVAHVPRDVVGVVEGLAILALSAAWFRRGRSARA